MGNKKAAVSTWLWCDLLPDKLWYLLCVTASVFELNNAWRRSIQKNPRLCCFCSIHLKLQKGHTCRCCHHWQWLALDHVVSGRNFILGSSIIYVYSSCPGELFLSFRRLFSHLSSASFNQVSASPLTEALLWIWTLSASSILHWPSSLLSDKLCDRRLSTSSPFLVPKQLHESQFISWH